MSDEMDKSSPVVTLELGEVRFSRRTRLRRYVLQWRDLVVGRQAASWWIRARALNGPVLLFSFAALGAGVALYLRPLTLEAVPGQATPVEQPPQPTGRTRAIPQAKAHLGGRQLFEAPRQARVRAATERNVTLTELSKGLQLQAIIGGDRPRAVIINTATNQLHQVAAGQFIGEIEVRSIGTTTVELRWKEESIELSL